MNEKLVIHVTERGQFKRCRRQWKYSTKMNLKPLIRYSNAQWFGRGIHNGLAGYYNGHSPTFGFKRWLKKQMELPDFKHLPQLQRTMLEETILLIRAMLKGYRRFAEKADDWKEPVAVEETLTQKIPGTEVYLRGTPDLIVKRSGRLWIVEHKSYASFVDPRDLELDDQITAYSWLVMKKYGQAPAGVIYNQLRKKLPAEPMLLKSGALSSRKNIDTTYEKFVKAIKKHGLDEADYEHTLRKIEFREFYRREIIARSTRELNTFEENLNAEALEMTSKRTVLYPHPTHECNARCIFTLLCKAENEGGDLESLIKHNYVVREGRDE